MIVDGSVTMNESRAIMIYITDKYAKEERDQLLGSTPEERAVVNQRLFFDATTVWPRFFCDILASYFSS